MDYGFEEIQRAMWEQLRHPPKYQLEDGTVTLWRGMPDLGSVINSIEDERERRLLERRAQRDKQLAKEIEELKKRREGGEKFYTWADVLSHAPEIPSTPDREGKPCVLKVMPQERREWQHEHDAVKLEAMKAEAVRIAREKYGAQ